MTEIGCFDAVLLFAASLPSMFNVFIADLNCIFPGSLGLMSKVSWDHRALFIGRCFPQPCDDEVSYLSGICLEKKELNSLRMAS